MQNKLGLITLENTKELGTSVVENLCKISGMDEKEFLVPIEEVKFGDGTGKVVIKKSVRDRDLYILSDTENPECSYQMYGHTNFKSPDDHYVDLRRVLSAISGHTKDYTVFMPFLYSSRQHSGRNYESDDCADALKDLARDGVKAIVTHDAHSDGVKHALARTPVEFQNIFATNYIIKAFLDNEDIDINNLVVVSPDEGAIKRAKYYAGVFRCNMGMCYKLRDLTRVINGKNPILEHIYIGPDVKGKDVVVVDDMIASGGSILDTARLLKEQKANKIYLVSTFALFTEGLDFIRKKYDEKTFNKMYSTNLTYGHKKAENENWFYPVDCSYQIAEIIYNMYMHESLNSIVNIKPELLDEVMKRKLKR